MVIYINTTYETLQSALLFRYDGFWMDFFRIKEQRRFGHLPCGGPPNLMHGFNTYTLDRIANHGHPV